METNIVTNRCRLLCHDLDSGAEFSDNDLASYWNSSSCFLLSSFEAILIKVHDFEGVANDVAHRISAVSKHWRFNYTVKTVWSHVGQLFIGCALYADDIVLMYASCYGLQKLVDVCQCYGITWDIKFHPLKSQLLTFGGPNPTTCVVSIGGNSITWVTKVKYLGSTFLM